MNYERPTEEWAPNHEDYTIRDVNLVVDELSAAADQIEHVVHQSNNGDGLFAVTILRDRVADLEEAV